jgi:hypothetical protein
LSGMVDSSFLTGIGVGCVGLASVTSTCQPALLVGYATIETGVSLVNIILTTP